MSELENLLSILAGWTFGAGDLLRSVVTIVRALVCSLLAIVALLQRGVQILSLRAAQAIQVEDRRWQLDAILVVIIAHLWLFPIVELIPLARLRMAKVVFERVIIFDARFLRQAITDTGRARQRVLVVFAVFAGDEAFRRLHPVRVHRAPHALVALSVRDAMLTKMALKGRVPNPVDLDGLYLSVEVLERALKVITVLLIPPRQDIRASFHRDFNGPPLIIGGHVNAGLADRHIIDQKLE